MKNDRLFQLLYILLEKRSVTAPVLAGILEVSVRTVYRDVEALSAAGVPIFCTVGKGGGVSITEGYSFDRALLSDAEQDQILYAIQSLRAVDQPVGTLLNKLGGMFHKPPMNWIEVDFSRWGFGKVDHERFDLLKTAILEKRTLQILYCGATGETSSRNIHPYTLVFKDKNWYLQAFCEKANDYRTFKVNRIVETSITQERFTEDGTGAPPLEYGALTASTYANICLRFSSSMAYRVYDDFDRATIDQQPDGSLVVCANMPLDWLMLDYLITFGTELEIIMPVSLRAKLADYAERIYRHHKT